jgi:hypothetical protein
MKELIIPGYKGIMDLDLTNIDSKFHHEMVNLHSQEIEEYKKEQLQRPKHIRYENCVKRILDQFKRDQEIVKKRENNNNNKKEEEYNKRVKYLKKINKD